MKHKAKQSPPIQRNPAILALIMVVAKAKKAWALETWTDKTWRAGVCELSLRMLQEYYSQTVEQIAEHDYDYFLFRAKLTYNPYGGPQIAYSDPNAAAIWEALEKNDGSLFYKHYKCYLKTAA